MYIEDIHQHVDGIHEHVEGIHEYVEDNPEYLDTDQANLKGGLFELEGNYERSEVNYTFPDEDSDSLWNSHDLLQKDFMNAWLKTVLIDRSDDLWLLNNDSLYREQMGNGEIRMINVPHTDNLKELTEDDLILVCIYFLYKQRNKAK